MAVNKRKILDTARKYVQKGAKQKALKEYERLLKLDPKDGKVRLEIGDAHRRWGQIDEAVAQYQKVADQYKADGFDARAVAVFKQVLNLDSKRYSAHVALAELYQRMGLDAEAIASLQTAADGYHREGKKREALELLRKMATLDPSNTTSRLKVADLLKQEGMETEAVAEFEAVAEELVRQENLDQVVGVYGRILEIQPKRTDILTATARTLVQLQKPERAEPFAKKAVAADGENTDHYELLCDIYKALEKSHELAEATRALARIYRERGDDERAREIMQRLPASDGLDVAGDADGFVADSDEPELSDDELLDDDFLAGDDDLDAGGDGADAFGDPFDASEHAAAPAPEPAAEPEPEPAGDEVAEGDPAQLLAEASVYLRYGKRDQAIASLRGVLAQEPENRDALEKLGEALAECGKTVDAVAHWQRAAELASADGDGAAVEVLRDRIAAIDPEAADAIPPTDSGGADEAPEAAEDIAAIELDIEASAPGSEPASADAGGDEGFELEIDLDGGPESMVAGGEAAPEAAASEPDPVLGDGVEFEIDLDVDDVQAGAGDAEGGGASSAGASSGGESTTSSQRIAEDLEEAEFYFSQGMMDEAEGVYRRVLEIAPNHPTASLRLGEIESGRAQDAGASDAADAEPALDIDIDGEGDGEVDSPGSDAASVSVTGAGAGAEDEDETTQSSLATGPDDDTGVDIEDAMAEAASAMGDAEATATDADGGIELDLDDDGDLAVEAGKDDASGDDDDTAESALSTPTLEQPAAEKPAAKTARSRADDTQPIDERTASAPPEDTFDLAAELRDVFEEEEEADSAGDGGAQSTVEDGFASIFSEFKKGVSATLTETDTETRYDLGIAYREMGLYEDAIGEFQVCLTSPDRIVDALTMMGLCALDLGRPADAVSHFEQALAGNELTDAARAALSFDLGRAFEQTGDAARAKAAYEAVAEIDPGFPEIQERIQALAYADSNPDLQVAPPPTADDGEGFESFDDLTAEAEADDDAGEAFESFDDVLTEAEAVIEDAEPVAEDDVVEAEPEPAAAEEPAPASPEDSGSGRPGRGRKKKISFV